MRSGNGPRLDEGGLVPKPAEIPDPLLLCRYLLFSGVGIEESQLLAPDPFFVSPARCARRALRGAIRQPARWVWVRRAAVRRGPVGQSRGRRAGRAWQAEGQVLLQICCKCSASRSPMQLFIAAGDRRGVPAKCVDRESRRSYAFPGAEPEPILLARCGPQPLPRDYPSSRALAVERPRGRFHTDALPNALATQACSLYLSIILWSARRTAARWASGPPFVFGRLSSSEVMLATRALCPHSLAKTPICALPNILGRSGVLG
jgi:hypothetical protein